MSKKSNIVIDISKYNPVTSYKALHEAGIRGIIHKATQGTSLVDRTYAGRVGLIRNSGFMHGAYHFGVYGDGVAQAKHFLNVVKPDDRTLLALDFEPNPNGRTMTLGQAKDFIQYIKEQTGHMPVFYSGHLIKDVLKDQVDPLLSKCPLWLAHYSATPKVPASWKDWMLWQYSDQTTLPGITGTVDRDWFNGDLNDLRKLWRYPQLTAPEK